MAAVPNQVWTMGTYVNASWSDQEDAHRHEDGAVPPDGAQPHGRPPDESAVEQVERLGRYQRVDGHGAGPLDIHTRLDLQQEEGQARGGHQHRHVPDPAEQVPYRIGSPGAAAVAP
jgi:hypothetical protein